MKSYQSLAILLSGTTLLTGCAYEPSDAEVYKVISNSINEDASTLIDQKFFGIKLGNILGIEQLKINAIEKIACDANGNKKVTCQVLVDFELVNKKD